MSFPGDLPVESNPQVERLLTQANLLRARGQFDEAVRLARQAVERDPQAWSAWELVGDLEHERTQFEAALAAYRQAHALHPARSALEDKIGVVALEQEEWDRRLRRARHLEEHPEERAQLEREMRSPVLAGLLSALLPGAGQMYNRQKEKGLILMVVHVLLVSFIAVALVAATRVQEEFLAAVRSQPAGTVFGLLVCLVAEAGLCVFAVLDGILQAAKINRALEEGEPVA